MARKYDYEYKAQAVRLAQEIGGSKAAKELVIPEGTIHSWLHAVKTGHLDAGAGTHTPGRGSRNAAQAGKGSGEGDPSASGDQ